MTRKEVLSLQTAIKLKLTTLDKFLATAGKRGQGEQAQFLGISPANWSRLKGGRVGPGATAIAAILRAFPHCEFTDFFEVEPAADEDVA